jgi:predicted 3-demethylubiquinone-9 3-methyltransferase (glyoxalase superfamily)
LAFEKRGGGRYASHRFGIEECVMKEITPFLWFDDNVEEAMNLYVSLIPNSRILEVSRYPDGAPGPAGSIMSATFELNGQRFMGLNGGPMFKHTEAFSIYVNCETQEEVDRLWERLSEGGEKSRCGWLKDRFGVWWQIVPTALGELMGDPDPEKSARVMQAMLGMEKLEIAALRKAHAGG